MPGRTVSGLRGANPFAEACSQLVWAWAGLGLGLGPAFFSATVFFSPDFCTTKKSEIILLGCLHSVEMKRYAARSYKSRGTGTGRGAQRRRAPAS